MEVVGDGDIDAKDGGPELDKMVSKVDVWGPALRASELGVGNPGRSGGPSDDVVANGLGTNDGAAYFQEGAADRVLGKARARAAEWGFGAGRL